MKTKSVGKFKQLKNKEWCIDTKVKVGNVFYHLMRRGFTTLADAKASYEIILNDFIKSKALCCKDGTLENLVKEYLKFRCAEVGECTSYNSHIILHRYLLNGNETKKIEFFFKTDSKEQTYNAIINNTKISDIRKNKVISCIKLFFKYAYHQHYIDADIYQECDDTYRFIKSSRKSEVKNRVAWSTEEIDRFFSVIDKDSPDYVMFRIFLISAPRLGEFLGTQVMNYDRGQKAIVIDRQYRYSPIQRKYILTTQLKTDDSYRYIPLDNDSAALLEEYIDKLGLKGKDYLFPSSKLNDNLPMSRTTFRRRLYYYEEKAQVRKNVPHGFRHTNATMLAGACETTQDIVSAAKRLGHSPQMFLNTYGSHAQKESEDKLKSALKFK